MVVKSKLGFSYMTRRLQTLSNGRVIAVLEGGYNLEATALAAEATVRTLLGEPLPLPTSVTKFSPFTLTSNITMTPSNLKHISEALQTWSKYWPLLTKTKELLDFEQSATRLTLQRLKVAGPSAENGLNSYRISSTTFSKLVKSDEIDMIRQFHEANPGITPKLIEIQNIEEKGFSRVTMQNLLGGVDHKIIANIILHRTNFDKEIEESEAESAMMGASVYQLKWSMKEFISTSAMQLK